MVIAGEGGGSELGGRTEDWAGRSRGGCDLPLLRSAGRWGWDISRDSRVGQTAEGLKGVRLGYVMTG